MSLADLVADFLLQPDGEESISPERGWCFFLDISGRLAAGILVSTRNFYLNMVRYAR